MPRVNQVHLSKQQGDADDADGLGYHLSQASQANTLPYSLWDVGTLSVRERSVCKKLVMKCSPSACLGLVWSHRIRLGASLPVTELLSVNTQRRFDQDISCVLPVSTPYIHEEATMESSEALPAVRAFRGRVWASPAEKFGIDLTKFSAGSEEMQRSMRPSKPPLASYAFPRGTDISTRHAPRARNGGL